MREHDAEPVAGLPEFLPSNESLVWQGAPAWEPLARRAFHLRKLAIYFAVLVAWYAATVLAAQTGINDTATGLARALGLALAALGLVGLLAWLVARSTLYTITTRRIVMRVGIALPMTINIPFSKIESASVRMAADGTGDILLTLARAERISYILLWPHARPWKFARVQPLLRSVPDAVTVAQLFGRAVAGASPAPVTLGIVARPDTKVLEPRPQVAAAA